MRDAFKAFGVFLFFFNANFQCFNENTVRSVVLREFHGEIKFSHDEFSLAFHDLGKVHKILINNEAFLGYVNTQIRESFQDFSHQDVKHFVNLDQILEKQEYNVWEEPSSFTEVLMFENVKDFSDKSIEVLVVHQDIIDSAILKFLGNFTHSTIKQLTLDLEIVVELDIRIVELR